MTIQYQYKPVVKEVFRAYDIRGIIGEELDADGFYSIGLAVGYQLHQLNRKQIFLARDGRLSSESLSQALSQGILDSGIDILDLGAVPTPVMYYATKTHAIDSGLMVTGSHNPASYNGIKIVLAGNTLANEEIIALYELNQANACIRGNGNYTKIAILDDYSQKVLQHINLVRPLRVVVDCGNGIAGILAPQVLKMLGCEIIPLFCEVDGNFPNHHPDPTVEANLIDLKAQVLSTNADLGLAFDGDGDRLGVVTDKGALIYPDRLMMLYAEDVLREHSHATIVYDVKYSALLEKVIKSAGGIPKMSPTGHSIVKKIMKDANAILAGEMSGHIFFKDKWYGFDDALYSACRLLEILSRSTESVHAQFANIPNSVSTPEIKIPIAENKKFTFMEKFQQQAAFTDAKLITMDGLRVEFSDGAWGLVRASNTSACLVARFEANDEAGLTSIQKLFKFQLHAIDEALEVPF